MLVDHFVCMCVCVCVLLFIFLAYIFLSWCLPCYSLGRVGNIVICIAYICPNWVCFLLQIYLFSSLYIIKAMDAQCKNTKIYNNIKQMLKISQISSSQVDNLVNIPSNIFSYLYPTNYISFQSWNQRIHIVFNLIFHLLYLICISLSIQTDFSFLIVIYYCDCIVFLT